MSPERTLDDRLRRARNWCAAQFRKRYTGGHPSHLAATLLSEAEENYDIKTCGVEGWCDNLGKNGWQYLNTGDSYGKTLLARTTPTTCAFRVGAWGDVVERGHPCVSEKRDDP